jgi:L-asparaginase
MVQISSGDFLPLLIWTKNFRLGQPDIADALVGLPDKTIVLMGALTPARFRTTNAVFNVGMAVAAAQVARPGVYIAMSGQAFAAGEVRKNRDENRFEAL